MEQAALQKTGSLGLPSSGKAAAERLEVGGLQTPPRHQLAGPHDVPLLANSSFSDDDEAPRMPKAAAEAAADAHTDEPVPVPVLAAALPAATAPPSLDDDEAELRAALLRPPHAARTHQAKADLEVYCDRAGVVAGEWRSPRNGSRFSIGDVVFGVGGQVGHLQRFAATGEAAEAHVLLQPWLQLSVQEGSDSYRVAGGMLALPCASLRRACIYTKGGANDIRTLMW